MLLASMVAAVSLDAPAAAQSSDAPGLNHAGAWSPERLDPGSADPGSVRPHPLDPFMALPTPLVVLVTYLSGSVSIGSAISVLPALGSQDFARPGSSVPGPVPDGGPDPSITATRLLSVEPLYPGHPDPEMARAQVWTVTSKAMQRPIRVEVYRAPAGRRAPMMYFLDGVGSEKPSGWSGVMGFGSPRMRERDVTVVAPTGAPSSMFADWNTDDPVLGRNRWETFLNDELAPLVQERVPNNGRWGTLGVSMGAGAAVHLAARNPRYSATGGVSGCYSTLDDLGYQYVRLTVAARGGDARNMWGPQGSPQWAAHDTVRDPSGLAGKAVYLSAATGYVSSADLGNFGSNAMVLFDGHLLEKGSYECTVDLTRALRARGIAHRVDYDPTGIHNWPEFEPRMSSAMDHLLPALGPVG